MQRITSSDSQFHDGDPSTGVLGTFLEAAWHNAVQEELAGFIEGAGIVLDPANNGQLVKALAARMTRTAPLADAGAINAYAAVNVVPLTAQTLVHGVRQRLTISATNSGASTYSPDGLPAKPILGLDLLPLEGLELLATQVAELEYVVTAAVNGGNGAWLLLRCAGGAMQLPAFSYGVTPSQFDNSTTIPTTAWVSRLVYGTEGIIPVTGTAELGANQVNSNVALSGAGSYGVTLPPAAQCPSGSWFEFFNSTQSGGPSIVPNAGDNIYFGGVAQAVPVLTYQAVHLVSDGEHNWYVEASNIFGYTPPQSDSGARLVTTAWVHPLAAHGRCRLSVAGSTQLKLSPYNGQCLNINGVVQLVPQAGVTLANTGLAANTLHYVYAFMNAGVMELEAVTTTHSTGSNGVEQKSGDASRTLVGMVYTNASAQFADAPATRFCLNWFNRRLIEVFGSVSSGQWSTSSGTFVELSTNLRAQFLNWGDEVIHGGSTGSMAQNTTAGSTAATVGAIIDGIGNGTTNSTSAGVGYGVPYASVLCYALTEGLHTTSVGGNMSGSGTLTVTVATNTYLIRG